MPFFAGASKFTVDRSEMNDVAGNLNKNETKNETTNTNSHNVETYTTKDSYNASSQNTSQSSPAYSSNQWKNKSYTTNTSATGQPRGNNNPFRQS